MKLMFRALAIMALCALCVSTTSPKQKVRAYKTVDRKDKWTVRITDAAGKEISKSTFYKNTDGLTTKSLYFDFSKGPNTIYVYKKSAATGNVDMQQEIKKADPGSQIHIEGDAIRIVQNSWEPEDKPATKTKSTSTATKPASAATKPASTATTSVPNVTSSHAQKKTWAAKIAKGWVQNNVIAADGEQALTDTFITILGFPRPLDPLSVARVLEKFNVPQNRIDFIVNVIDKSVGKTYSK